MLAGIGIDLVEINRIKKIIDRWGSRFTERIYSDFENRYCAEKAFPEMHYAARFAAKEAFLKSLGIGLGMGVNMKDVEVKNSSSGKPELYLFGRAIDMLDEYSIVSSHLTLTHTKEYAMAVVVLEK
jgi:holo-[acyl-carrier protein] synthase